MSKFKSGNNNWPGNVGAKDLGVRYLVVSHVENATTLYAYTQSEAKELAVRHAVVNDVMSSSLPVPAGTVELGKMYVAKIKFDREESESWIRGLADENLPHGRVRFKAVDSGRTTHPLPKELYVLPQALDPDNLKIVCKRYKLSGVKPKGREEGFSAADREAGAEWLRLVIGGRTVKARCHEIASYKGGIMFDGEVGGINLNVMSLRRGFARPAVGPMGDFAPPFPPFPPNYNHWDKEYFEYRIPGVNRGKGFDKPADANQIQKMKNTQMSLEAALSKRNKEIAALKKNAGSAQKTESFHLLSELVAKVQEERRKSPEAVKDQDPVATRILGICSSVDQAHGLILEIEGKEEGAERSHDTFTKCQEQSGSAIDMNGPKRAVLKYVGDYLKTILDLQAISATLQNIIENEPLIPRPVIQMGTKNKEERDNLIRSTVSECRSFATTKPQDSGSKSDSSLDLLCLGMTKMIEDLKTLKNGGAVEDMPAVDKILKAACKNYSDELKELKGLDSPSGQQQIMVSLAKSISLCLSEKDKIEKSKEKFVNVHILASSM